MAGIINAVAFFHSVCFRVIPLFRECLQENLLHMGEKSLQSCFSNVHQIDVNENSSRKPKNIQRNCCCLNLPHNECYSNANEQI